MTQNITRENVLPRVQAILRQQVGNEVDLSPETDLQTDLGIESLELVELGVKMEQEFGKKIPIRELRVCVTIEDVVQLVQ